MDTVAWLATAIAEFRTPDPAQAPADALPFLAGAFAPAFNGDGLVHDLAQAVALHTGGRATLAPADTALFPALVRGPAAYLRLTREQLLILQPAEPPVTWPPA